MNRITLDSHFNAVVEAMGDSPHADLGAMTLSDAMRIARPAFPISAPPPHTEDRNIPGIDGSELRLRIYYPETCSGTLPVVLYLHGGGFVGGSIEMDDIRCSRLAALVPCIVVSLDYRLAPENPFPNAIEDTHIAWSWLLENATDIGGDNKRTAIYGSSAGGHIAVAAMLLARERGMVLPQFQLLANPALDPDMSSQSYSDFENGPFMTKVRMAWYWRQYSPHQTIDNHWIWAPMKANLAGLPPTHVMTAEYDVLRDEGEAFVEHLNSAGVKATTERYKGMIHGFITILPDHPSSLLAMNASAKILAAVLYA